VSITSAEPVLSTTPLGEPSRRFPPGWRAALKWIALALVCFWLANKGFSLLIQHSRLNRMVTSRLEAAFGRPVQVARYSLSLWTGPTLFADSVTVGEDPRFGQEYFLRADSLAVTVRWLSLFSGHLQLDTISLSHPSLNLVRDRDGDWNLAEWLPRPANARPGSFGAPPARFSAYPLRFRRIDIDNGRIDFKGGDEKLPFALVGVAGTLETEGAGRWRIDLVAVPSRAAVIVQQPGALHLVGHVGGTSSRLRPAEFQLAWSGASISDVLRLARSRDYGLRGNCGLTLAARAQGDSWLLQGKAFFTELHRWDLALRPDDPALNILANATLDPSGSRLDLNQASIEFPHSEARVTGALDWTLASSGLEDFGSDPPDPKTSRPSSASKKAVPDAGTRLRVASEALDLADVFAWARAFHLGISDAAALHGSAQVSLDLASWPPRLQDAGLDLPRAELRSARLRVPVRLGPLVARFDQRKGLEIAPTTLTFGAASNSFRVDGDAKPGDGAFAVHIQGSTAQLRDAVAAASLLGWDLARGWDIAGPARCDLRWQGTPHPWRASLSGTIEWGTPAGGISLHPQFLNLPVERVRARSLFRPGATRTIISSAQAFGAHWTGTLDHDLSDGWQFAVSGDSLSAADLDRWLNPRWRESFLDRLLPFLNSRPPRAQVSEPLRATGRLSLDQFALGPVVIRTLRSDLALDGRHLELSNLDAQFYRGQLSGSLHADLQPAPQYEASVDLSGVDLHAFASEFPALADIFTGSASAKLTFLMRGATRPDLIDSLQCHGAASANDGSVVSLNLAQSIRAGEAQPGATSFRDASAAFVCAAGKLQFDDLRLAASNADWEGAGTITYARDLDLRLHPVPLGLAAPRPAKLAGQALGEYRLTGTLGDPRLTPVPASAPPVANAKP
jgi:AsmA-like C-terminal region/AsmA family